MRHVTCTPFRGQVVTQTLARVTCVTLRHLTFEGDARHCVTSRRVTF